MRLKEIVNLKTIWFGTAVGSVSYLISWVIGLLDIGPKTLKFGNYVQVTGALVDVNVREQLVSGGIANPIGIKILALLTAIPQWDWKAWFTLVVGSIILVIIGRWVYSWKITPKWKNTQPWRLAGELFYGGIGILTIMTITGLIVGNGIKGIPSVLITMAIYYVLVSIVIYLLLKIKFISKVMPNIG